MISHDLQGLKALIAEYCKYGYKLFLLAAGTKIPFAGSNGVGDATDDVEQIECNLNQYPDANLAIAAIDILIADVDNKKGKTGSADLAEMEEELGKLPDCPTVRTTTDGYHYYFAMPAEKIVGTNGLEGTERRFDTLKAREQNRERRQYGSACRTIFQKSVTRPKPPNLTSNIL